MYSTRSRLKPWELILIFVLIIYVIAAAVTTEQTALSSRLIRLRVIAASNSESDQAEKLLVRDAVLAEAERLTADCTTTEDAAARLSAGLPSLLAAASSVLGTESGEDLKISLTEEFFPTTEYDTFSLPAGRYRALKIEIGAAAGHNWWCVVFPQLCTSSTGFDALSTDELNLVTENGGYIIKFRIMELSELLLHRLGLF